MRIPKYRKHSSGQARVTLGGQTYYLGKYGTKASKDEYNRLIGEYIASGGVIIREDAKSDLSIAEMLLAFLKWAEGYYGSKSTELVDLRLIIKRIQSAYATSEARNVSTTVRQLSEVN